MNPFLKLTAGALLVVAAIGYLAFVGAAETWQYYLSVDEAAADVAVLRDKRIRVSGRVQAGTLTVAADRRQATFELHGERHKLHTICRCALPDNLVDDMEVVVEGTLRDDGIHGRKVITRCASKYNARETSTARDEATKHPARATYLISSSKVDRQ